MSITPCLVCNFLIPAGDAFCQQCGTPVTRAPASQQPVARQTFVEPPADDAIFPQVTRPGVADAIASDPMDAQAAGTAFDPLLGEAAPNTTYLGQRLLYQVPPEETFDPITNRRFLFEMLKHAIIFFAIWVAFTIFLGLISLILSRIGSDSGHNFGVPVFVIGQVLGDLALFVLWLLLPIPALLSEWKYAVDEKGSIAATIFNHITWSLTRRRTPIESARVRRLSIPGQGTRDYLELRDRIFRGYISCFDYGEDLYIGWTFWLYLSPGRWFLMLIARVFQTIMRRGTDLYVTLRFDVAKAMREVLHSSAREGVDVAAGYIPARGQGTVGSDDLPIDVTTLSGNF
jgi:hypothetical protein